MASKLNPKASAFVPSGTSTTTSPATTSSSASNAPRTSGNKQQQHHHHHSSGMNPGAPSYPQNSYISQPPYPYYPPNLMYPDYGGYMMPPQMAGGYPNQGQRMPHVHSKKSHQGVQKPNGNINGVNNKGTATTSSSSHVAKSAELKSEKSQEKDSEVTEEPKILFGDVDSPEDDGKDTTQDANAQSQGSETNETNSVEVKVNEEKKKSESVVYDDKKLIVEDTSRSFEQETNEEIQEKNGDGTKGEEKIKGDDESRQEKLGKLVDRPLADKAESGGWKRNVTMVEKTTSQMLLRNDGVIRYGKSQLCSLNTWNKTCPPDLKEMYSEFTKIERPPMSETTRQKSPTNRQGGRGGKGGKSQQSNEPHPDELKIFNPERLNSDALFGSGRPDKVVDTSTDEAIISQANFILNVMTIETFDKMSDKFMKAGLETEELMKAGVDLIVTKAQLEEHFSFMYAELCKKITDQWVTEDGEEGALGKQFRKLLLVRCQEEFEQDREAAVQSVLDLKLPEEEEEEKLLILKKRYTGHMRFVGEIYMKDMLKANKMHYCINELLESTDENGKPDNEKLACLCKLLQTIGKKLEDYEIKKKRSTMNEYFDKISAFAADKRLSSKVRFAFKDLMDMRKNNWTARRVEEKAKKLSEIRKDEAVSQSTPRQAGGIPRNTSFGKQDARAQSQDVRNSPATGNSSSSAGDEWTSVASKGRKGRGGSSSSSSTPTASSSNNTPTGSSASSNKFSALHVSSGTRSSRDSPKSQKSSSSSTSSTGAKKSAKSPRELKVETGVTTKDSSDQLPGHDGEVDDHTTKRIIAAFNEYYSNDLVEELVDVLKELVHPNGMWKAVHATMHAVMGLNEANRKKYNALLPKLYEHDVLSREQTVKGVSSFLHEFDDFVIDVPLLAGYFSAIMAHLYVGGVFEQDVRFLTTLPDENDFSISYRAMSVVVQTAVAVKDLSSEEKSIEFFKSAVDVSALDSMQKDQLAEAVQKLNASYLPT